MEAYTVGAVILKVICFVRMSQSGPTDDISSHIRQLLKCFVDVIKIMQTSKFAKCNAEAIKNAFKWAETVSSLSKIHPRELLVHICKEVALGEHCARSIIDSPAELVLQLLLESPVEQTVLSGAMIYHEGFKCACASLGPDRTATIIAQVLQPRVHRIVQLRYHHDLNNENDIKELKTELAFLLLRSLHYHYSTGSATSAVADVADVVGKDSVTLHALCTALTLSANEAYLHIEDKGINKDEYLKELMHVMQLDVLWDVVCGVANARILFFLDSLPSAIIWRICCHRPKLKETIENSLLIVGENSIMRLAGRNYGKVIIHHYFLSISTLCFNLSCACTISRRYRHLCP